MLITFDLDDTLICWQSTIPKEKISLPWYLWWFRYEPLRKGTVHTFQTLRDEGWKIGIYTTSNRSECYIKRLFKVHGLKLDLIVNQYHHEKIIKKHRIPDKPSKFPCSVGSYLHIDDSVGVRMEGEKHLFRVLVIDPMDRDWSEKILEEARKVAEIVNKSGYATIAA